MSELNLKKLKKSKLSKKLLSKRTKLLKKFIKLKRDLRQQWCKLKAKSKWLQKLILLELLKHSNSLFIEKKEKLQRKMRHQSIKLRGQTLVARTSTKEDLILQGDVMTNKIKIKIIERLRGEKQLITMKIKNLVDKDHKKKKEKMKTKIVKNRLKVIRIGKINKTNYQKT